MKNYTPLPDATDVAAANRIAVAAQLAGPALKHPLLTVREFLGRAYFAPNEYGTLSDSTGVQQRAMDVTIDGGVYTVYCKRGENGNEWSVRCPSFRQHNAINVIEAVKQHIRKAVN